MRGCIDMKDESDVQALVDKLKSLDSSMTLVTTKQGYLYLQVSGPGIQLASEVQNLVVVPAEERSERDFNRYCNGEMPTFLYIFDCHVKSYIEVDSAAAPLYVFQVHFLTSPVALVLHLLYQN